MTLNNLKINQQAIITKINGEEILKRRLLDLGFIPQNKIKCILSSPFKDPKAYLINQNVISLRNLDAQNIEVEYV